MKALTFLLILLGTPALLASPIEEAVQKGLAAEEVDHDLDRAIAAYQAAIGQFDGDRKAIATAIYRLAECERKQGHLDAAQLQYARIVREFSDQTALAQQSQAQLQPAASQASAAKDPEAEEIKSLQSMLATSPDLINAPVDFSKGPTLLQQAIGQGEMKVAAFLIEQGADLNLSTGDSGPPLFIATRLGRKDLVESLLAHGANVNFQDGVGAAALHLAANRGFLAIAEALIAAKADVNIRGHDGCTPIFNAATSNHAAMIELLLKKGAELEAKQENGWTPLQVASAAGKLDAIRTLLAHHADPQNCLIWAVDRNYAEVAKLLLEHGADAKSVNNDKPLIVSALEHKNLVIAGLLQAHGADVNAKPTNVSPSYTPLFNTGDFQVVQWLIEHGADLNRIEEDGHTALVSAIDFGNLSLVKLLVDQGADVNQAGISRFFSGSVRCSPLVSSQKGQQPEIEKLLSAQGATAFGSDAEGILVARKSVDFGRSALPYGRPFAPNRYRLFDVLQAVYQEAPLKPEPTPTPAASGDPSTASAAPSFRVRPSRRQTRVYASGNGRDYSNLLFPALDRLVIHRWSAKIPRQETLIPVNVLNAEGNLDPKQNLWLQNGDVIEIPEQPHSLAEKPYGLTAAQMQGLDENYARQVTFQTALGTKTLSVPPQLSMALQRDDVLPMIPSDADSSHLEVRRTDPASGKPITFTANVPLGGNTTPEMDNVWLLNGDTVKIPSTPAK